MVQSIMYDYVRVVGAKNADYFSLLPLCWSPSLSPKTKGRILPASPLPGTRRRGIFQVFFFSVCDCPRAAEGHQP